MSSLSRRKLLSLTAIGFSTSYAGCNQISSSQDTTATDTTTQTQDGSAGPAPSCTGEYSSFTPRWVVEGSGPLAGFNLNERTRQGERSRVG